MNEVIFIPLVLLVRNGDRTCAFEGETNVAVALMHIQSEITPPRQLEPSIPVSFEKIILKCTEEAGEKYASARELIADLRRY
ncbi:MAG: hypothetical protein ACLTSO_08425 [Coprococcus sp.]